MLNPLLLSKQWCKLVFEGRNKDYGAYIMRRDEGKYQLRALLIVAGCFALLLIVPMALIRWQMYVAKRTAADAVANFSNLKQPEVKKNHELKAVDVAQKINVKKIKDAIKFVPEISPDEKVEAQLILGANEIGTVDGGQTIVSVPDSMLLTDSPTDSDDPDISGKSHTRGSCGADASVSRRSQSSYAMAHGSCGLSADLYARQRSGQGGSLVSR